MTLTSTSVVQSISNRMTKAFETCAPEEMIALFVKGGIIWHNFDRIVMTPEEVGASLVGLWQAFEGVTVMDVELHSTATGYVQQYVLKVTHRETGKILELPACIIVQLDGELIARVDEYVDPTPLAVRV